ncbi:secretion pathway protein Sls2/Rcy1 [Dothidotthia symphoricarpi CBS 119687]|uniref:Secretion pathway protein Sls2/Rcy1 n=1 Tax=Dothidotthia symphoricarpi CBS 119687 TaxID=1392245 RepID=A0A6A6AT57_9PLEO|nr:secretion pathway protein Sls2/Rcy1 [Dothidotthia symphoricarpi CBS 119687]KAF2134037.1 secretion pathway protein Sls2/Rcy1 [Dothidotthia symphoricarpi CBS 119687]
MMATKSNFKRALPQGPVLSSVRSTRIVDDSKAILPAELINTILDYLPVPDIFSFARTSKRMQEMVYDDTRWIQRLNSMGCWNETEARQRFEETMRRKLEAQRAEEARKAGVAFNGSAKGIPPGGDEGQRKISVTLFDATLEEEMQRKSVEYKARPRTSTLDKGFNDMTLSSSGTSGPPRVAAMDPQAALKVLSKVRSIRGMARQEYGKVYGALAPYYFDLARSRSHADPILFRTYRDPEQQALILSQLKTFAKSDYAQGWNQREEKLDTMTGIFENAVLREFEQGHEEKDFDGRMKRFASVLVALNGGAACLDLFIHNHPLMLEKDKLGSPMDCLQQHGSNQLNLEPSHEFFRGLAIALNDEAAIIDRVFPPTVDVLQPFLERVVEDVISEYLTTLLDEAHDISIEVYLKAVVGVFDQALQLAVSLQPTKGSKSNFQDESMRTISHCFEQHIDLYLQEELDFFKRNSAAEVDVWEKRLTDEEQATETLYMSNVNRKAAKQDFLSSFKKVVMMPVNVLPTMGSYNASKSTVAAPGVTGISTLEPTPPSDGQTPSPRLEAPRTELAAKAAIMNSRLEGIRSLFSIEVALNLTHKAKSSLERAARFVRLGGQSGEEARELCEQVFIYLVQILGNRHMKLGLDKAVSHLAEYRPREVADHSKEGVAPLVAFLELVNVGDLIQQMVEVFYFQELVAANLTDRDDFLSLAAKERKRFEAMLDERVAAGLNKGIDVLMDEVEYLCGTTQQPSDFNPPVGHNGAVQVFDIGPSPTATKIVDIVSSHTSMLVGSTDKNVLDVFNQEVGVRLFAALCKHLKRQRVSVDGAIKLISDMNAYNAYIVSLRNKSLMQYFAALRELSQIYLIDAKDAKEIATIIADTDRYHGIFRSEEVYEYAERRADWYQIKSAVEKQMYGVGCLVM